MRFHGSAVRDGRAVRYKAGNLLQSTELWKHGSVDGVFGVESMC